MYAVSGGNWHLATIVGLLNAVQIGTTGYYFFGAQHYGLYGISDAGAWCVSFGGLSKAATTNFAIGTRACIFLADFLILLVTWRNTYITKRRADRHHMKTPLSTMLLWDGTAHFVLLLSLNVFSIAHVATTVKWTYSALHPVTDAQVRPSCMVRMDLRSLLPL